MVETLLVRRVSWTQWCRGRCPAGKVPSNGHPRIGTGQGPVFGFWRSSSEALGWRNKQRPFKSRCFNDQRRVEWIVILLAMDVRAGKEELYLTLNREWDIWGDSLGYSMSLKASLNSGFGNFAKIASNDTSRKSFLRSDRTLLSVKHRTLCTDTQLFFIFCVNRKGWFQDFGGGVS